MEEREAEQDRCLTLKPAAQRVTEEEEAEEGVDAFADGEQTIWLAPLNDFMIEWVYIIDLDREVFSVNNGAHFKLDRIPHIDWMGSLADGRLGDKISLPFVGEDAAGLVNETAELSSWRGSEIAKSLDVSNVKSLELRFADEVQRNKFSIVKWSSPKISRQSPGVFDTDPSSGSSCSAAGQRV